MTSPTRLGRYEVLGRLGQGGMGAVYKARDPALDRTVAIKTLNPILLAVATDREEFVERLRREARAAGKLSHPHIVSVFDIGFEDAGTPFIVMEYVPGATLAAMLSENPSLPVAQAVEMIEQVGAAIEEAHRHGIIHRDIKPANVFLDARGRVKVGDFGIARIAGSELTQTGVGLGTPGYLAPEVLRGGRADVRSDVFSLGALAYQLLTGSRPFGGPNRESMAAALLGRDPDPPATVRADVPPHVSAAVMKALAKARDDRTPTVGAFLAELGARRDTPRAITPLPTAAARRPPAAPAPPAATTLPTSVAHPSTAVVPRGRRLAYIIVAAGLALAAGAMLLFRGGGAAGVRSSPPLATLPADPRPAPQPSAMPAPTAPESPRSTSLPLEPPPTPPVVSEPRRERPEPEASDADHGKKGRDKAPGQQKKREDRKKRGK